MVNKISRFSGPVVLASALIGFGELSAQETPASNWSNATNGGGVPFRFPPQGGPSYRA